MAGRVGVREGVSEQSMVWAVSVGFWVWLSWSSFPHSRCSAVLCTGSRKALVTPQSFGSNTAGQFGHSTQRCLSNLPLIIRSWEGTQPGQWPKWAKGIFCTTWHQLRCKNQGKEEEERANSCLQCLPPVPTTTGAKALLFGNCLNNTRWWEVENKLLFFSLLVHVQTFAFALLNCLISAYKQFSILFSLPCPSCERECKVAWLAPGVQTRSTHHKREPQHLSF